jgi:hypothetical protein
MDKDFNWKASLKSEFELRDSMINREKYLPETVEAAVAELQKRGAEISDEELMAIDDYLKTRRSLLNTETNYFSLFTNTQKDKEIIDPEAPAFYSKRAIYLFSILFSVLFGSVMLAVNIMKTPKRLYAIWVILYGLAFTTAFLLVASNYKFNSGVVVVAGIAGAYPLNYFFWGRYIGHATLFRVKPIWIPLIIGLAIIGSLVFLTVNYGQV